MTTKQWLLRARKQENKITALRQAKARAYDRAISTTTPIPDVFVASGCNLSFEDKNAEYAIVGEEVDRQLAELNRIRAEILRACSMVRDNTLSTLLIEYYVNGKTWEQVAAAICYSYSQTVKYLHPKALQTIKDAIECHNVM